MYCVHRICLFTVDHTEAYSQDLKLARRHVTRVSEIFHNIHVYAINLYVTVSELYRTAKTHKFEWEAIVCLSHRLWCNHGFKFRFFTAGAQRAIFYIYQNVYRHSDRELLYVEWHFRTVSYLCWNLCTIDYVETAGRLIQTIEITSYSNWIETWLTSSRSIVTMLIIVVTAGIFYANVN